MPNALITPSIIAKEAVMQSENELVLGNTVHVDYSKEFMSVGDTISVRRPVMFESQSDNLDITGFRNDVTEGKIPITMNKTESVSWEFDSKELTLSIEEYSERYIKPAVIKLKDKVESEISKLYREMYWFAGTPGTRPGTFKALGEVGTIMTNASVPLSGRMAIHSPDTALELADGLKNVYVQGKAKTAFEEATIGRYARFENYESVHVPRHTVGGWTTAGTVNGANQNVTYAADPNSYTQQLVTGGWVPAAGNILNAGDVITIAGVFAVNPVSKVSTGRLQTFVVTANAVAAGGASTLTISPKIITSGPYQTVTAAPANGAVITVRTGAAGQQFEQSLLYHKNAIALVTRPLAKLDGASWCETATGNKMSISVVKDLDFNKRKEMIRLDILFGLKLINPQLAARLTS